MEIKTCEQYVLNELSVKQAQIETLEQEIEDLKMQLEVANLQLQEYKEHA